ncbi:hypothetical protein ACJ2A9_00830 [Anaerobacillus sp. MEB173]|uniref:hypothetical protein n=1 Tax=Anaerobacillus sp. MEB173 TaxID=3383345 RepID=UPI003F9063DE
MEWAYVIGILIVLTLIYLFQWPRIKPNQKREKVTFLTLMVISFFLSIFLVFFPDTTSPLQLIVSFFRTITN